jgi:hypothetical protein
MGEDRDLGLEELRHKSFPSIAVVFTTTRLVDRNDRYTRLSMPDGHEKDAMHADHREARAGKG